MEYIERGSLRPLVGRVTIAQTAGVLEGVLAGLAHAETRGIVHRDLKPENVMVTAEGAVKIADFGIAKALGQAAQSNVLSVTGAAMGTPAYMAPEQALAAGIGPWTDLYSTGVIAYELLLGRLPFDQGDTPVAVLMQVVNEPIPPPREINPDLDPGLAGWVERMLAKEPAERPPGAAAAWEELEEIVIALLGPRWRREARLVGKPPANGAPRRLLPVGATTEPRKSDAATRAAAAPPAAAPPTVPAPATRGRRRFFVIVVLALVAVAGLAVAIVPGRLGEPGREAVATTTPATTARQQSTAATTPATTTPATTAPPPEPAPRPIANELRIGSEGGDVTASVLFEGQALKASGLQTIDSDISDGQGSFVLWQKGIGTRVGRKTSDGVTLVVTDKPPRLHFDLVASPGAFTEMSAPRIVGKTIEVDLVAAPPPVVNTTPRDTTPPTTTKPTPGIG